MGRAREGEAMTPKALKLLRELADMEPGVCRHDYDRKAFRELHQNELADWQPRGWAGIGIHITDAGRARLANRSVNTPVNT